MTTLAKQLEILANPPKGVDEYRNRLRWEALAVILKNFMQATGVDLDLEFDERKE